MPTAAEVIRRHGGVASIGQLRDAGLSDRLVQALCKAGVVQRVRRGWYATANSNALVVQATRAGGSLACVSGAAAIGVWQPPGSGIHVSVPAHSRHLKDPLSGEVLRGSNNRIEFHWSGEHGATTSFRPGVLPILECLVEVLHCQPEDLAFAVVESALHLDVISRTDVRHLIERVPSRARMLAFADGKCESGSESLFRFRMRNSGLSIEPQVEIPGVGRVDFLIGDRLIVEIDSETYHGQSNQRRRDLERDAVAAALDFETLRFDYRPVMVDWEFVASTVQAVVARGAHLRPKVGN